MFLFLHDLEDMSQKYPENEFCHLNVLTSGTRSDGTLKERLSPAPLQVSRTVKCQVLTCLKSDARLERKLSNSYKIIVETNQPEVLMLRCARQIPKQEELRSVTLIHSLTHLYCNCLHKSARRRPRNSEETLLYLNTATS